MLSSYISTFGAESTREIPNRAIQKLLVIHFYFLIDVLRKAVKHCCYCYTLSLAYFLVLERSIISNEGESEIPSNVCFLLNTDRLLLVNVIGASSEVANMVKLPNKNGCTNGFRQGPRR